MGKMTKRERLMRKRRMRMLRTAGVILGALAVVCIIGFAGMSAKNRQPSAGQDSTAYYVEGEQPEVLAPPFVVENEADKNTMTEEELQALFAAQPTVPPMDAADYTVTITAVGDCTLGGGSSGNSYSKFKKAFTSNGADYFFENVRGIFEQDDITLVNLEGPLTEATSKRANREFNFRGDPEYINILTGSSVEAANVANNHAYDYQKKGFEDTLALLDENNIAYCGHGQKSIMEVNGVKVGLLGFTMWDHKNDEIRRDVQEMDGQCDILVVSLHAGTEKRYSTTSRQKELAHLIVDAGADLVIGTHPHVVGEIENYKGVQIVYSVGNFCFGGNSKPFDTDAIIYQQTFTLNGSGITGASAKIYPVSVSSTRVTNNYQPTLLHGSDAERVMKKIANNSKPEGLAIVEVVQ